MTSFLSTNTFHLFCRPSTALRKQWIAKENKRFIEKCQVGLQLRSKQAKAELKKLYDCDFPDVIALSLQGAANHCPFAAKIASLKHPTSPEEAPKEASFYPSTKVLVLYLLRLYQQRPLWYSSMWVVAVLDGGLSHFENYLYPHLAQPWARHLLLFFLLNKKIYWSELRDMFKSYFQINHKNDLQNFWAALLINEKKLNRGHASRGMYNKLKQNVNKSVDEYNASILEFLNNLGSLLVGIYFIIQNVAFFSPAMLGCHAVLVVCCLLFYQCYFNQSVLGPINDAEIQNNQIEDLGANLYFEGLEVDIEDWRARNLESSLVVCSNNNIKNSYKILENIIYVVLGLLIWTYPQLIALRVLKAQSVRQLTTTFTNILHLEKVFRAVPKFYGKYSSSQINLEKSLDEILKHHERSVVGDIKLDQIAIVNSAQETISRQQFVSLLQKPQKGYCQMKGLNGTGKTMLLSLIQMYHGQQAVFISAIPEVLSGQVNNTHRSSGEFLVGRMKHVLQHINDETVKVVLWDEISSHVGFPDKLSSAGSTSSSGSLRKDEAEASIVGQYEDLRAQFLEKNILIIEVCHPMNAAREFED